MQIIEIRQGNPAVAVVQIGTQTVTVTQEDGTGTTQTVPVLREIPFWPELLDQWTPDLVRQMILSEAGAMARTTFLGNLKAHYEGLETAAAKIPDHAKATGLRAKIDAVQAEIAAVTAPETDLSVLLG